MLRHLSDTIVDALPAPAGSAWPQRGGRRTRDGRTPFIAQEKLAAWFKMPQPDISRIEKYWLEGDWANLLSLKTAEVLTGELMARIVAVFVTFPWWGVKKVYRHLREQEVAVSEQQVRQAAEQSGWSRLRQELVQRYHQRDTPYGAGSGEDSHSNC